MSTSPPTALAAVWEKVYSQQGLEFPVIVATLASLGVSRYRVDYTARAVTAYFDGSTTSDVYNTPWRHEIAPDVKWDAAALKAAIHGAQTGTIGGYRGFCEAAVTAGVTDYTCYIKGKRVVYSGALGDVHTEWFPGVKTD